MPKLRKAPSISRKKSKTKQSKGREGKKSRTLFQSPKGMHDILPEEQPWWNKVRKATEEVADFYGFQRIDTPMLEDVGVFEKGIGDVTDIVEKQMFILRTRGGDHLALRPENTAPIIRSYFEHSLRRLPQPLKLYYIGPFFRYERPQAGRYRQFHQVGFEIIGDRDDPLYDAQLILLTYRFFEEVKIKNILIQLNSIGCKICRPIYRRKLVDYYRKFENKLCKDCKHRLNVNPLRLLDCKNESCEALKNDAPMTINHLCQSCRNHFKAVLEYLDELGIPYTLNSYLVRGLDYYNRTVFEVFTEANLSSALGGGGRYDYLGEILGGRRTPLPAIGSAPGIERIIETLKAQGTAGLVRSKPRVFVVQMGDAAKKKALILIEKFRQANTKVSESLSRDSLKAQLRIADKEGVDIALILGQREVFEDSVIVRDMKSGSQETVPFSRIVEETKKRLNSNS